MIGIMIVPTLIYYIFSIRITSKQVRKISNIILITAGIALIIMTGYYLYFALVLIGLNNLFSDKWNNNKIPTYINLGIVLFAVTYLLAMEWLPMGTQAGTPRNFIFVILIVAFILGALWLMVIYYEKILRWCLANRWKFMTIPILTILFGLVIWQGSTRHSVLWQKGSKLLDGGHSDRLVSGKVQAPGFLESVRSLCLL